MIKFKHKKTGKIVERVTQPLGYCLVDELVFFPDWAIEESNDWEEVVEKEYEILSVIDTKNRVWSKSEESESVFEKSPLCVVLDSFGENWRIHSVKRLSDDEVFTIGDLTTKGVIHGFEITPSHLSVSVGDQKTLLRTFDKVKQPLFVTEDGVDIYKNQKYYGLYTESWLIEEHENGIDYDIKPEEIFDFSYLTFSTKEKVEEYVLENTPCLSVKDVTSINLYMPLYVDKLREIAKSKIQ